MTEERRTPAERLIADRLEDPRSAGRPLSSRARQSQRSLEHYLKAGVRPRWMERLIEIERGMARERRRLADAHAALNTECGHDRATFARRWRALARRWSFADLNELIGQHNAWYPIERDLPMDLHTRDYVLINGRSYRRRELDAGWILEQFPPSPPEPPPAPDPPARTPAPDRPARPQAPDRAARPPARDRATRQVFD